MSRAVLALNAGSSSIKFTLYAAPGLAPVCDGMIDALGTAPHLTARDAAGALIADKHWENGAGLTHEDLLQSLLGWIESHLGGCTLSAVGHRIVHGGGVFTAPTRLTPPVLARLDDFSPLAPLHQRHNLAPVRAIAALRPDLPQIGCFDTAFHHTLGELATALPLPRAYRAAGVRRYGFHGLSYAYIARKLPEVAPDIAAGRVIVAHLGNGASLCALRNGRSVETSMGFTALDGLMMGTRCGSIDAGVVLYMLQQQRLSAADIEHILYQQSGLRGVSGISADMRVLLASTNPHARDAIDLFVYSIIKAAGALAAVLGGIDGFVLTAGIGEHAAEIRARVCAGLAWLGVVAGQDPGAAGPLCLSAPHSPVRVYAIPTDEEAMIARHVLETLPELSA